MPQRFSRPLLLVLSLSISSALGCGGSDGPSLIQVDGTVTYQGSPLAGARVTFLPENGPVATGVTDMEGKFTLQTAGRAGAVVGHAKVSIDAMEETAPPDQTQMDPNNPDAMKAMMSRMIDASHGKVAEKKSAIPRKYSSVQTSGLTAEVTEDASQNHFQFELQ